MRTSPWVCGLTLVLAMETVASAAPPSLETFVLTVGGNSSGPSGCYTFSAPAPVNGYFGPVGAFVPIDGLAPCGVDGGFDDQSATVGPLYDDRTLTTSWNEGSFDGDASAVARFGHVTATTDGWYAGQPSSTTVIGSDAFGRFDDAFTFTSPSFSNGQSGNFRFYVTVAGAQTTTGPGYGDLFVRYQVNAGPIYTMLRVSMSNATDMPFIVSLDGVGVPPGMVAVPGSVTGSGVARSFLIPFTFGSPLDFTLGAMTYAIPLNGSTVVSDFDVMITGIEVTGPLGQSVTDWTLTAASGAQYDDDGVTAVGRAPQAPAEKLTASPNPAGTSVRLSLDSSRSIEGRVEFFDVAGRRVRDVPNARMGAGHIVTWDGRNDRGEIVPSGVYFARWTWSGGTATTRITWVR